MVLTAVLWQSNGLCWWNFSEGLCLLETWPVASDLQGDGARKNQVMNDW